VRSKMVVVDIVGGGPDEWVWSAIAAGDVAVVRAAPTGFDACGIHPRYGSVLTAFLQALLNLEGRFLQEAHNRGRRAKDLIEELGRRGARPDLVIQSASFEVKSLYRDWRITGDVTAMQVVTQMRNDLLRCRYEDLTDRSEDDAESADADAGILTELIERYAELAVQNGRSMPRSLIPDAVVDTWERCLKDRASADVDLVSPDGRACCHSLILARASPVVAAMLASGMREGQSREVMLQEPVRVAELFLSLLYTGCLPQEPERSAEIPTLFLGARVVVRSAFTSNSARSVLLPAGMEGEVQVLDDHGDTLIRFDSLPTRQWVARKNFSRLRLATAEGAGQLQEDLAGALSLAHRWQATGLAEVLADRLERELTAKGFEAVLEVAVLHGIARLEATCLAYARNSSQVRAAYEAGKYGAAVSAALEPVCGGGAGGPLGR